MAAANTAEARAVGLGVVAPPGFRAFVDGEWQYNDQVTWMLKNQPESHWVVEYRRRLGGGAFGAVIVADNVYPHGPHPALAIKKLER